MAKCLVCGDEYGSLDEVVGCSRCETEVHVDCFEFVEKCPTYGCRPDAKFTYPNTGFSVKDYKPLIAMAAVFACGVMFAALQHSIIKAIDTGAKVQYRSNRQDNQPTRYMK